MTLTQLQTSPGREIRSGRFLWALVFLTLSLGAWVGRLSAGESTPPAPTPPAATPQELREKWGIEVIRVALTGYGNMVDFRYKVLDPVKAAPMKELNLKPLLLDETTGARLHVPTSPKVGPMRHVSRDLVAGKTYFMIFANTQHHVRSGDKVSVVVGGIHTASVTVE